MPRDSVPWHVSQPPDPARLDCRAWIIAISPGEVFCFAKHQNTNTARNEARLTHIDCRLIVRRPFMFQQSLLHSAAQ